MRVRELTSPALSIPGTIWAACCLDCPRHQPFTVESDTLEGEWPQMRAHQERTGHRVAATNSRPKREKVDGRKERHSPGV